MRNLTALAIGATLLALTAPAAAEPASTKVIEAVPFHDLDLSTPAGVRKLNQRIGIATEAVCGSFAEADFYQWDAIGRCRAGVRQGVEQQVARAIDSSSLRLAKR